MTKQSKPKANSRKKPMKKSTKITIWIVAVAAVVMYLIGMAFIIVDRTTPVDIEKVTFKTSYASASDTYGSAEPSYYPIDDDAQEYETTDRASRKQVQDLLKKYDIKSSDTFCLNYSTYGYRYEATIYYKNGTEQNMGCTTEKANSKQKSKIREFRNELQRIVKNDGKLPVDPFPIDF